MMKTTLRVIKVVHVKNSQVLADKCVVAESFFNRLKGLLGTTSLKSGEGLLLRPCNDIHMWFMSIPIDVIFIRRESTFDGCSFYRVTSCNKNLQPWRMMPLRDGFASETLELPVGTIDRCHVYEGDVLCIS